MDGARRHSRFAALDGGVAIDGEFTGDFCVLAQFRPDHFAPFFPVQETQMSHRFVTVTLR